MDSILLATLQKDYKERTGNSYWDYTYPEWSPGQMGFLESKKRKLLLEASRRSGKSVALAERMIRTVNTPVKVLNDEVYGGYIYIAPTKADAKAIIWNELKNMCKKRGQPYISNEVELKMTFPNGGFIQLEGAGLSTSAEKARGKKNIGVAIDEAAFIGCLQELVGIWGKTLYDYNGEMVLSSSPGKSKHGYFYQCSHGDSKEYWDRFYLKGSENPIFKNGRYEKLIAEDLKTMYGNNENHPEYIRECLGQWIEDTSSRLIKFDPKHNLYDDLHIKNTDLYDYVIGLDVGYLDSTSLVVAAVAKYEPQVIFVDEFEQAEMRIGDIVTTVEKYVSKWSAGMVVVDSGGMGHHTYRELQAREGLPAVDRAQKYGKKLNIELLNNSLYARHVLVSKNCKKIQNAWKVVLKNDKGTEDEKTDYGSQGVLDILDATLYAYMECHPTVHDQIAEKETIEQKMYRKKMDRYRKKNSSLETYGMKGFIR